MFCSTPTYFGGKTGQITHVLLPSNGIAQKTIWHITLLRRLVGSEWGTGAKTLCTAALFLVYSTVEYYTPVWCCSAHTCFIDNVLKDGFYIVTGCLHPTPTDNLSILSSIQPADLCQLGVTFFLAYHGSLDPDYILYGLLNCSSDACQERLRSRCSFVPAAQNLLNNLARLGIRACQWRNYRWNAEYCKNTSRFCVFIPRTSARFVGMWLP